MMITAAEEYKVSCRLTNYLVEKGVQRFVIAGSSCPSLARDAGFHLGLLHGRAGAHQAHMRKALLQGDLSTLGTSVRYSFATSAVRVPHVCTGARAAT